MFNRTSPMDMPLGLRTAGQEENSYEGRRAMREKRSLDYHVYLIISTLCIIV
jgi:hypothetical protein